MALIRGFSKVDEDGKIAVPLNIRRFTGLTPEYPVEFAIMRVKDTSRRPHIYFFRSDHPPYLSPMEVTMMEGTTVRYAPGYFPEGKRVMVKKQVIPLKEAERKSPFRTITMDLEY